MNKNGWGLRVELAFILLFLVCLLIATIGLSKFGLIGGEKEAHEIHGDMINDSFNYSSLENKLTVSANKYYNEKYNVYKELYKANKNIYKMMEEK